MMVGRKGRRGGAARRLTRVAAVLAIGMASVVATLVPAGAAPSFSAAASVTPGAQPQGSETGATFTFAVHNTGSAGTIGAVEITRASSLQTVVACPIAPAGWTVETSASRCRFRSAPGTDDDIGLGQLSSQFWVSTVTSKGNQDTSANWSVKVSRRNKFDDLVAASAEPPGLTAKLHSFEVFFVGFDPLGPTVPGGPCPEVATSTLLPGSTGHTVVICGRNGTRSTLTPTAAQSSLAGSLLSSSGRFSSGRVPPSTGLVVLGTWTGAVITTVPSGAHTLDVRLGSDARHTAATVAMTDLMAFNAQPAAVAAEASMAAGTSALVELTATDLDLSQSLVFSIADGPGHGSLGPITPTGCVVELLVTCRATVRYTPAPGFVGADSFSYRVNDGIDDGSPAVVSLDVFHPSDPPVNGFAIRFGGPQDDVGRALAVDGDGNTLVTGRFQGTIDLDPGAGVQTATSLGQTDVYLAKYGPAGQLVWAKTFGSTTDDAANGVAVDTAGNIAITGGTAGAIDFGGGPRSGGLFGGNGFVASFTPDGVHRWSFEFGDQGPNSGLSVAFDASGDLVVGGLFSGTVDFDPGPGVTSRLGGVTGFVAKYSGLGDIVWVDAGFGTGVTGLDVGPGGEVAAAGQFRFAGDFDPGPGVTDLTPASIIGDAFVVKLDPAGALVWARGFGAFFSDNASDVAVDGGGNLLVTGSFQNTVDFDPGPGTVQRTAQGFGDLFMLKLTPTGDVTWVTTVGGPGAGVGGQTVDTDAAGNVVVAGGLQGTVDADPGPATSTMTSVGNAEILVASYGGASGSLRWAGTIGGPGGDAVGGLTVTGDGTVRIAGADEGGADYDPAPGGVYDLPALGGLSDAFLVELDALGQLS